MKQLLLYIILLAHFSIFACDGSTLTLFSGPTAIGGGKYSAVVRLCTTRGLACQNNNTGNFMFGSTGAGATFDDASCSGTVTSPHTAAVYNRVGMAPGGGFVDRIEFTNTTTWFAPNSGLSCVTACVNITLVFNAYPSSVSVRGIEGADNYASGCSGPQLTVTFAPLPIELLNFKVENKDLGNQIEWVTASERNNDFFLLERSTDGVNWNFIDKIKGAGNSSSIKKYTSIDYEYKNSINYYRLSQIDFDGTFTEFGIIVIYNFLEEKKLIKTVNLMGQVVDTNYNGLVIKIYSDGSTLKEFY